MERILPEWITSYQNEPHPIQMDRILSEWIASYLNLPHPRMDRSDRITHGRRTRALGLIKSCACRSRKHKEERLKDEKVSGYYGCFIEPGGGGSLLNTTQKSLHFLCLSCAMDSV
jgi:hypothetical protein